MNTINTTEKPNSTSIRKQYLSRRAEAIRETFAPTQERLDAFLSQTQSTDFMPTRDEAMFMHCIRWMREHLHEEAAIGELATHLHVSVRKIQRLFQFFLKKSYTSALLEMRLEVAKDMLKDMRRPVGEIAYRVGIRDHAYFTFLFRKSEQMTPSEYRIKLMEMKLPTDQDH